MNRSPILAGLFAAFVVHHASAPSNPLDQPPSPTVVHGELVTVGGERMEDGTDRRGHVEIPAPG
ncbi:hypothetical protein EJV46_07645 [Roseococcus sp. SYP-B2431]|uniref:hypothetical protein n=1 Tax=Roseococcus sp. SYP-B2431 TaxID=2496640 RepID=UPI00103B0105|nr:hypothetical protein [Roseococcus sp. SYP-B2431]TCI00494.1 hypothetical protein EJV46_07645 [Roseococcus sp. SYP-B2431]